MPEAAPQVAMDVRWLMRLGIKMSARRQQEKVHSGFLKSLKLNGLLVSPCFFTLPVILSVALHVSDWRLSIAVHAAAQPCGCELRAARPSARPSRAQLQVPESHPVAEAVPGPGLGRLVRRHGAHMGPSSTMYIMQLHALHTTFQSGPCTNPNKIESWPPLLDPSTVQDRLVKRVQDLVEGMQGKVTIIMTGAQPSALSSLW